MIDCKHAARLMSRAMDDRLPLWDRVRLRLHLAICDACTLRLIESITPCGGRGAPINPSCFKEIPSGSKSF